MAKEATKETKLVRIRIDVLKYIKSKAKFGETLSQAIERLIRNKTIKQETSKLNETTQTAQKND